MAEFYKMLDELMEEYPDSLKLQKQYHVWFQGLLNWNVDIIVA